MNSLPRARLGGSLVPLGYVAADGRRRHLVLWRVPGKLARGVGWVSQRLVHSTATLAETWPHRSPGVPLADLMRAEK